MHGNHGNIDQLAACLAQLGAFIRSRQWRDASAHHVTPTQLAILRLLQRGPERVTALAGHLGVTQATASDAAAALADKGLIARQPDPHDRRAARLALTEAGARTARETDHPPKELAAALATLSAEDRAGMQRAVTKVIRDLQMRGAIAPQRMCVTCRFFRPHVHNDAQTPHHCAFVDAAFGDGALQLDCGDHALADADDETANWTRFVAAEAEE